MQIVLEEAHADYEFVIVNKNAMDKPAWYVEKVNPAGKVRHRHRLSATLHLPSSDPPQVPALTYGGPPAPPRDPSPECTKLAESAVINEFLADVFSDASPPLRPTDPVARARMRLFVAHCDTAFRDAFRGVLFGAVGAADFLGALEALQCRLAPEGYALGAEWSLADAAIAPFLLRTVMFLEHEFGRFPLGEGRKMAEALRGPRFARLMRYVEDIRARPSVQKTWDEVCVDNMTASMRG